MAAASGTLDVGLTQTGLNLIRTQDRESIFEVKGATLLILEIG
jgi:hypothetical protein